MRRALRDNGLTIFFGLLFLGTLVAQAIAGHAAYNAQQLQDGGDKISLLTYVLSASYGAAVLENWQSEYLQFTLYILLTVWLVQRGSPESKQLDKAGLESDKDQKLGDHTEPRSPRWARVGGLRTKLYSNSLVIVMGFIWLSSWLGQSIAGWTEFTDQRLAHLQKPLSWVNYLGNPDFWERTFQNWQSEFLAVASMSILSVYLRQRGSAESKPVGSPHDETATEG